MVNKIMYQKIQYFKRKGFAKADIVRKTGLNKRTVWKCYKHRFNNIMLFMVKHTDSANGSIHCEMKFEDEDKTLIWRIETIYETIQFE